MPVDATQDGPPRQPPLQALLRGWRILGGILAAQLLFLTLEWPMMGLLACGFIALFFGILAMRDFLAFLLLAGLGMLMVILQLALLETRVTPLSLLNPGAVLVPTAGLHIHPDARRATRRAAGRVRHFQVAALVPAGWEPGQPVPYWVLVVGGPGPARQPWAQPLAQAALAPALDIDEGRDLAREMAARWGSPMPDPPVMVLWVRDAAEVARRSRDRVVAIAVACLAAWPVLFSVALAWSAFSRHRARPSA
ncbi:hypothetical protein HB662_03050 [Roseomonas frigidaquae]|uniref:DUF58 domain-containing protein n=1 Tax=Falsiroseomonas frigidaquae TaxID=487318 RepID=A0ABX1ESY7_9PROT|nr:hypothetical protein [Falsiroseomonas frigidaquae]NKE43739.1 hypothetical protein [Falsiroseomonas frigidaquae]